MTPTLPAATQFVSLFDIQPLRPLLEQGRLLLTPNRRLASRIRATLVSAARADGAAVVPTPAVLAIADWLDGLWQQGVFCGLEGFDAWVLSPAQERVLWERVIRASEVGQALLRPAQAADLAADAMRTLVLWRQWPLHAGQRGYFSDADTVCFIDWLDAFKHLCNEQGCITVAERDQRVVAAVMQSQLSSSQAIAQVCFDEIAPLYADLFTHLRAETVAIPSRNAAATVVACDSFEQQIRAGVRWIRGELQRGSAGPFALVVPDLGAQRQRVERILLDEFNPEHLLPGTARQLPPVNFSAGEPLSSVPIVQSALRLLGLALPENSHGDVIAILQSPFHSINASHGIDANQTDIVVDAVGQVCDLLTEEVSGGQLRGITAPLAEKYGGWLFDRALQQLADHWRRQRLASVKLPLSLWAEHFRFALTTFGWPGTRTLDSLEYQQVSQWGELLGSLSAFDVVCGALSFSAALTQLRQLAQAHVFQPKTPDAPIQVLGLLEAAGLQFEGTWLCDMGDDKWPPPAAPHPLLPRDWQRRLRMPHCDAEREFAIAQQLSESLRMNARQFVVSYQRERDEVERHVSPLFLDIKNTDLNALAISVVEPFKPVQVETLEKISLRRFDPGAAPPLDTFVKGEGVRARGGSALLADQAACPFRAFARHRLRAEPLSEPQTGLSASERGTLLHAALQSIWLRLQNVATLRACEYAQLKNLADDAAQHALQQLPDLKRFGARFLDLERQRLMRVLVHWLTLEKDRADFAISALEDERQFKFAGLELRLRVDRVDRLPDGRVTIVDYKSGQGNSSNAWLGERPEQPQLPLYALALENENPGRVAGVLFAQVRLDNARWVGVGDNNLENYSLQPVSGEGVADWPAQLAYWQQSLQKLVEEFIQGRADVAPASPKSCQYCALPSVCRIDHADLIGDDFIGDEEEGA